MLGEYYCHLRPAHVRAYSKIGKTEAFRARHTTKLVLAYLGRIWRKVSTTIPHNVIVGARVSQQFHLLDHPVHFVQTSLDPAYICRWKK